MNINEISGGAALSQAGAGRSNNEISEESFAEMLDKKLSAEDPPGLIKKPEEEKPEESYWLLRMELTKKHLEQREELSIKRQQALALQARKQAIYGKDYREPTPVLSAAQIIMDLLSEGGI